MTIGEMEQRFVAELTGQYGEGEAVSLANLAIGDVCDLSYGRSFQNRSRDLSPEQELLLSEILDGLKKEVPLQYLMGVADFFGLKFKVAPGVLIPRPETEELVDWILKDVAKDWTKERPHLIVDIGTGSGCIPIALKKKLPEVEIISVDVSEDALGIASANVLLHEVDVKLIKGDVLAGLTNFAAGSVDIIVSNPPYITGSEMEGMHANVLNNEPELALFVPDEDPLLFYRVILELAQHCLVPGGSVYFEINSQMGNQMLALLDRYDFKGELRKDISGQDRMIKARRSL
ncbi:release factor glutamine methyltransferase [Arcticibacter pallidicorallinus]|uniref:peptide chain release factor N(5)-glutamine methyltransferase n=1 Tax=Arcticibacter pallidicorallinus TaxID=1259464 RepID=A0A2T0U343_9SPHI|nr:peptide chain release factor N(5)-glutamine methyltransferase [Arcticibacter pallidicorallinus]PRY52323.1 release factor glutamine methyltransferase [Arcticibacter pallidicorallinus]